jgi:hypothetical protein
MIPSGRLNGAALEADLARPAAEDGSDARRSSRTRASGREREQQLVIFAAVERALHCRAAGQRHMIDLGRHARSFGEPVKIQRQPVAQVYASRSATQKFAAQLQPRLDPSLPRFAQAPGNPQRISGPRAVAPQSLSAFHCAADRDVAIHAIGRSQIPTRQSHSRSFGHPEQTAEECFDPSRIGPRGQRNQAEAWMAAHRGNIAQGSRQRALSNPSGRATGAKMHALDRLIRGE